MCSLLRVKSEKHCRRAFYSNSSTFASCQTWKIYKAWRGKICILGVLSKFPRTPVASHSSEIYFVIIFPPRYHLLWNISAVVSTFYLLTLSALLVYPFVCVEYQACTSAFRKVYIDWLHLMKATQNFVFPLQNQNLVLGQSGVGQDSTKHLESAVNKPKTTLHNFFTCLSK